LYIYNPVCINNSYPVYEGEYQIVFESFEDVAIILKDRFKLIKKIKERKNIPFKAFENKKELFKFSEIDSISILKEKKKLLLSGDKIPK
jgi:hypothetical protein